MRREGGGSDGRCACRQVVVIVTSSNPDHSTERRYTQSPNSEHRIPNSEM